VARDAPESFEGAERRKASERKAGRLLLGRDRRPTEPAAIVVFCQNFGDPLHYSSHDRAVFAASASSLAEMLQ
jgi:hypothetical protein